jgi:putative membrane protein
LVIMALLDEAALSRIEAAINDVEQRTAGEIVVVDVPASDGYHEARLLYGAAFALAAAAAAHMIWPALSIAWLLWLEIGVAALVWFALGWPPLLRALIAASRLDDAVQRRARDEFLDCNVFATRDRSGVLIFLSELEHRVVLLGDSGIHERVHTDGWQHHVTHIVQAIRAGRPGDGVCEVITELGAVLAECFPPRPDNTNELPNTVRQPGR